jgi:hypothetical protein
MRIAVIAVPLLPLLALLHPAPARAAEMPVCPAAVTVDTKVDLQGKALPPGGWSDAKRATYKLTSVAFYTGRRGEELKAAPAQLKPEQKEENKKMTESWSFGPKDPSLAICHYKGTEMTVGIELPPGVQSCQVVMTRSGTKSYHTAGTAVMSCK